PMPVSATLPVWDEEPDQKAYVACSINLDGHRRFRPHNGRSGFAAGTGVHTSQPTFKKPARMCREPIFSSLATKIPLLDLDRVRGMGQSCWMTLRRPVSAQAR